MFKEHFSDKNMADPVYLNFCIFSTTYVLSFFSCLVPLFVGDVKGNYINWFMNALIECVMPTTATLILGCAFQNYSIATQNTITHYSKTFWAFSADIIYIMFYPIVRIHIGKIWVKVIVAIITLGLLVLCLSSVAEVEENRMQAHTIRGNHERSLAGK